MEELGEVDVVVVEERIVMGDNKPSRFSAPGFCFSGPWEICLYACASELSRIWGQNGPFDVSDTHDLPTQNIHVYISFFCILCEVYSEENLILKSLLACAFYL